MSIDAILHHYGIAAVFAGAALEGEAVVTTGGYLAGKGLFSPFAAAVAAFAGSCAADQLLFFLARFGSAGDRSERLRRRRGVDRALSIIERRPRLFCAGFRFVYGFRVAGPLALGLSRVPLKVFVSYNILSALAWGTIFTWLGYRFGNRLERVIRSVLTSPAAIAVAVLGVALLLGFLVVRRRRQRRLAGPESS